MEKVNRKKPCILFSSLFTCIVRAVILTLLWSIKENKANKQKYHYQEHQPQFIYTTNKQVLSTYCAQQPCQVPGMQQQRKQKRSLASLGLPSDWEDTLIRGFGGNVGKNKPGRSQR